MFTESSSKAVGAPISAAAHSRSIFDDCILEGKGSGGRGRRGGEGKEGEWEEGKGKEEGEGQGKGEGGGRVLTPSLFC